MLPLRRDYGYIWGRDNDVAEFTAALALRMKSSSERIKKEGIDVERISLALLRIYRDWWAIHWSDLEVQALFAVAAASPWIWEDEVERLQDILDMLDEVAEAHAASSQSQNEFTGDGLRLAVERALGATVQFVLLQPDLVEVSFTNGNYGDGLFDGVLCLDKIGGLYILNKTRSERQDFQGTDLPRTDAEVEESLASDLWKSGGHPSQMFRPSDMVRQRDSAPLVPSSNVPSAHDDYGDDSQYIYDSVCYTRRPEQRGLSVHRPITDVPVQEIGYKLQDVTKPSDVARSGAGRSNEIGILMGRPSDYFLPLFEPQQRVERIPYFPSEDDQGLEDPRHILTLRHRRPDNDF